MTEHPAKRQQKEQREEDKVPSADEEHQQGEQQPVDGETHQNARPEGLGVRARDVSPSGLDTGPRAVAVSPA
jgi:hypothetical protein